MEHDASFRLNLTLDEARNLAQHGRVVPLVGELPGDLLTPVGAFLRLASGKPYAFLLESVEGGERIGRYSFLGFDPWLILTPAREASRGAGAGRGVAGTRGDPLLVLRAAMKEYRQAVVPDLPPFAGGIVGNLAYDAVRSLERLPNLAADDLEAPDLDAAVYDAVVAFDRLRQRIQIVVNLFPGREGRTLDDEYEHALDRIERIAGALEGPVPSVDATSVAAASGGATRTVRNPHTRSRAVRESLTRAEFESRVRLAQEEISRGEIFQVVLSRRVEREFVGSSRVDLQACKLEYSIVSPK